MCICYYYLIFVQETCHPLQDTDDDIGYADADSANLVAFDFYHSAPACCANEVEVCRLHGKV